jgi:multimeric flavodoxin WrbA
MKALVLNCTLKPSPETSNTEALARVVMDQLEADGVGTEIVRLVDLDIKPGVKSDQGPGDDWPKVR